MNKALPMQDSFKRFKNLNPNLSSFPPNNSFNHTKVHDHFCKLMASTPAIKFPSSIPVWKPFLNSTLSSRISQNRTDFARIFFIDSILKLIIPLSQSIFIKVIEMPDVVFFPNSVDTLLDILLKTAVFTQQAKAQTLRIPDRASDKHQQCQTSSTFSLQQITQFIIHWCKYPAMSVQPSSPLDLQVRWLSVISEPPQFSQNCLQPLAEALLALILCIHH